MNKHKPILLKKLASEKPRGCREVIGLTGTHRGAGVTYTGLMLAFYLGEVLGKKTAYLECNSNRDMRLIQKAYEWQQAGEDSFSYRQITCYKEVKPERVPELLGEDYDYFLLDFGSSLEENREEFYRCTRKLIIGGCAEWNILKLLRFVKANEAIRGNETWLYLLPFAKAQSAEKLTSEIKRRVRAIPAVEEPTHPNRSLKVFLNEILR